MPVDREKALRIYADRGAVEAAEAAGVSKRTVQRWAAKAGVSSGYVAPILSPCPSAASYQRGCRCDGCSEASASLQRQLKRDRVLRLKRGEAEITHGVSGFINWSCHCDTCKTAWAAYQRNRRSVQSNGDRPVE